jgi:hypothetical protein
VGQPPQLFSYVVDHDLGFAPNPYDGYCSLVHCKFGGEGHRRNIVEMAAEGDWILGSGGAGLESAGINRVVYLMRVDEKLSFWKFLSDARFRGREDAIDEGRKNLFALVSTTYFYFGRNALPCTELPLALQRAQLLKRGRGYRSDLDAESVLALVHWFRSNFEYGMHGPPCSPLRPEQDEGEVSRPPQIRRKSGIALSGCGRPSVDRRSKRCARPSSAVCI